MIKNCYLLIILFMSPRVVCAQQITRLTCNYERDPIAVDDLHPRLSWQIQSSRRNDSQTAYQILVSSSPYKLSQNIGDIWDSRKNPSNQSLYIPFKGTKLQAGQTCYWKVRIWDNDGKMTPWSQPATWRMGLLNSTDWQASWITASKWFTPPEYRPQGLQLGPQGGWADIDLGKPMPVELIKLFSFNNILFPSRFKVMGSNEFNFVRHTVLIDQSTSDYVSKVPGAQVFPVKRARYRYIRLQVLAGRKNLNTIIRQIEVFSGGNNIALMKFTREYNTSWSLGHAPFLVDGMPSQNEKKVCPPDACPTPAAPMFRTAFTIHKTIKQATLYYAALGMLEVSLNGQKVGHEVLGPPFTDYYKRIMYETYDITSLLKTGSNTIGAVLGNGFFSTPGFGFGQRQNGNGPPRFILQAMISYTDGSSQVIGTGPNWKWSRSEITFNDIWEGYTEDRHLAKPGWNLPEYQDTGWYSVTTATPLPGKLVARSGPPNQVNDLIKPVSVKDNHALFSATSVGWPLLKLNGKTGQVITVTGNGPGSRLARLTFTLDKDGPTTLSPKFIIQPGPTDIQVNGLLSPLTTDDIAIQYINANLPTTGVFTCSNPFLDTLYDVTMRTHRNYTNDFPADPNREKQGWTQDVQNMFPAAAYLTDVRSLYWRWWNDMADNQDGQGYLGSVVPVVNRQVYDWNSPWWSGMIIFLPWEHYRYYGNTEVLEKSYPAMCRYLDFLDKMAKTGDGNNWYAYPFFTQNLDTVAAKEQMIIWNGAGDWNNPYTRTLPSEAVPAPMTTMPAWYCYAQIASKTAALLGKQKDASKYAAMAEEISQRFNTKYYHAETGLYGESTNSETGQVLPLALGMAPVGKSDLTYQRLIDAIHAHGDHVGTGFVSINYLLQTLTNHRESALANKMISQKDYPGWHTLMQGGVFREDWHGNGTQMPSCGGAIGAWLFQSVLGIRPDDDHPGFRECIIAPQPDKATGLTWANGSYESGYGRIAVNWKCENNRFVLDVDIPANTKARICLPTNDINTITESGSLLKDDSIILISYNKGLATYQLGSGKYHFETGYVL